jgi:hypothetical protein
LEERRQLMACWAGGLTVFENNTDPWEKKEPEKKKKIFPGTLLKAHFIEEPVEGVKLDEFGGLNDIGRVELELSSKIVEALEQRIHRDLALMTAICIGSAVDAPQHDDI